MVMSLSDAGLTNLYTYFLSKYGANTVDSSVNVNQELLTTFGLQNFWLNQSKQRLFAEIYTDIIRRKLKTDELILKDFQLGIAEVVTKHPGELLQLVLGEPSSDELPSTLKAEDGLLVGELLFHTKESAKPFSLTIAYQNLSGENPNEGNAGAIEFISYLSTLSEIPAVLSLTAVNYDSVELFRDLGYDVAWSEITHNEKTRLGNAIMAKPGILNDGAQFHLLADHQLNPHSQGLIQEADEDNRERYTAAYNQLFVEVNLELNDKLNLPQIRE